MKRWLKRALARWHLRWMRAHPEAWMHTIHYEGGVVPGFGPPSIPGKAGELDVA